MPVTVRQMTAKDAKRIVPLCGAMERKTFPKHESLAASFEREVSHAYPRRHIFQREQLIWAES
jgi:hypothetical protein